MGDNPQSKKVFYGWWLLGICWLVVFLDQAFPNYGATVMNGYMAREFHASRESMGGLFSLYLAVGGLPGLIAGSLVTRTGSRVLIGLGGLSLAAGAALMAFWVKDMPQAMIAFGGFVGFSILAGGFLGTQYALAQWFHRRRALAMAILYSASGVGGFVAPVLLSKVIELAHGNWRIGWWLLIAAGLLSALLGVVFIRDKPEMVGQLADNGPRPGSGAVVTPGSSFKTTVNWTLGQTLASPVLWALLGGFVACTGGFHIFLAHGTLHLLDKGFTPTQAASAVAVGSIASLVAKTIVGLVGDRIDPRYMWGVCVALIGIGVAIMARTENMRELVVFACCIGGGFGGSLVCMVTTFANYFGVKVFPILSGLSLTLQGSLAAVMPVATGYVFDKTGTYNTAFYGIAGFCAVMALLLLVVKRPSHPQD